LQRSPLVLVFLEIYAGAKELWTKINCIVNLYATTLGYAPQSCSLIGISPKGAATIGLRPENGVLNWLFCAPNFSVLIKHIEAFGDQIGLHLVLLHKYLLLW